MVFQTERPFTHTNERNKTHCEKTIESRNESMKITERTLRNLIENQELVKIEKILKTNEATKRQLQQRKLKKFSYLKYKPQPMKDQTSQRLKQTSRNVMQMPLRPTSSTQKFIIWNTKQHKYPRRTTNSCNRLELLNAADTQYCRGKSLIQVLSNTKQTSTNREKEIEHPRNQIKLLKQN